MGYKSHREAGMATLAIALTVSLMLLAVGFWYVSKVAKAEDQGSRLQAAADAAALAGAQSIVSEIPGQIVSAIHAHKLFPGSLGQSNAAAFASRNDATLTSYHYDPLSDRVTVTVRSTHVLVDGSHGAAAASAKVGLSIGLCAWPTPTPSPTPTPDPALPPVDADATAKCGDLLVPITIPGGSTEPVLRISAATLKAKFTPALAK